MRFYLLTAVLLGGLVTNTATAEEKALYTFQTLTPKTALQAAQAALEDCRKAGYQVSVAVLDRGGAVQVLLRDQLAGFLTPDNAISKARTALSFRTNTSAMVDATSYDKRVSGIRHVPGTLMVGGGVLIEAAGSTVGVIGVSGAPEGDLDEKCALAGIQAIQTSIEF